MHRLPVGPGRDRLRNASLGVVPIGYPLPGMHAIVVDEDLAEVAPGERASC